MVMVMLTIIILGSLIRMLSQLAYKFPSISLSLFHNPIPNSQFPILHSHFSDMAVSGFEGFEKRLELHFSGDDPLGLRRLPFDSIQQILTQVQCSVVSAVGNHHFDAYVLSESSLFVYPSKIIIKTCGTTLLLKAIPPLLHHALNLGHTISSCRYTRGDFIFPLSQPFPHTSFQNEVVYLENSLPEFLCFRKASVMPSNHAARAWHVFFASDGSFLPDLCTVEMCMTDLDRSLARRFFRFSDDGRTGHSAGKDMTEISGIDLINPGAIVCDFAFDPCGYSMNGIDGDRYSTIHVTPEDGFSYASFECAGEDDGGADLVRMLQRAVQVFRPAKLSVAVTMTTDAGSGRVWARVSGAMERLGLKCRSCTADEFPAAGTVVFQTFSTRRKKTGE